MKLTSFRPAHHVLIGGSYRDGFTLQQPDVTDIEWTAAGVVVTLKGDPRPTRVLFPSCGGHGELAEKAGKQ